MAFLLFAGEITKELNVYVFFLILFVRDSISFTMSILYDLSFSTRNEEGKSDVTSYCCFIVLLYL